MTTNSNQKTIEDKIREFVKVNKPKLYILTPCYGSMCHVSYMCQLLKTLELFHYFNCNIQVEFCSNDSLVPRARNNLIARAMNDPSMTHILFIDSDITWNPIDIFKLLISEKSLVGGIYPLKKYNWNKLSENPDFCKNVMQIRKQNDILSSILSNETMIQANLLNYNVNYIKTENKIVNNLIELKHIATGFMMISRTVIEKMSAAFPSTKYEDDTQFLTPEENKFAYALFDCGVEEGHYFSEDWMFCSRWSKMKGEIYADVSIALIHSGIENYNGNYTAHLLTSMDIK